MAKERSEEKKEKKHKEKKTENDGVKKSKKEKKSSRKTAETIAGATEDSIVAVPDDDEMDVEPADEDGEGNKQVIKADKNDKKQLIPTKHMLLDSVPFAKPMADEKEAKKVFKGIKKAAKNKLLKRGVKEVVKAIRKSAPEQPSSEAPAIVVLAADISPFDVISHIPVLCEDFNVPYIFVPSRVELGAAGNTKRPTSVVMMVPNKTKIKGEPVVLTDEQKEWGVTYGDVSKVVKKAQNTLLV